MQNTIDGVLAPPDVSGMNTFPDHWLFAFRADGQGQPDRDFTEVQGKPSSMLIMQPGLFGTDQNHYATHPDGTSVRAYPNKGGAASPQVTGQTNYLMYWNLFRGRLWRDKELAAIADQLASADAITEQYGFGKAEFFVRGSGKTDANKEALTSFPLFQVPNRPMRYDYAYEKEGSEERVFLPEFVTWARANEPDRLTEPYIGPDIGSFLMDPNTTVAKGQMFSIQHGKAVPKDLVHPGVNPQFKLENERLLEKQKDDLNEFLDSLTA